MIMGQQIIIFDSPDGTGKTNIAKALADDQGVPYFKMNTEHENWRKGRFKEALEFDQTYLLQFLTQTGYSVVIDRAYPAEWVYSKVFKRETNQALLTQIDEGFSQLGTTIIVPLRRDYSKNRQDELVPNDKLQELHNGYLDFCEWTKCGTMKIHVDDFNDELSGELYFIKRWLENFNDN